MQPVFDRRSDRRLVPALAVGVALWFASTCGTTGPETVSGVGTVEFLDLEGGCWAITTEAERYEPTNLPPEFEEDGLRVRFEAELRGDAASVCQIGPIVELQRIERAEP